MKRISIAIAFFLLWACWLCSSTVTNLLETALRHLEGYGPETQML